MTTRYPWYWAWRGWRASTWIFLLWSSLMWRQIVPLLQDDDGWLSRDLATGFVIFWLLGVWFVGMARLLATADGVPRRPEPDPRSVSGALRAVAPFAAAVLLAFILVGPTSLTVG
jgi:hypothetical protein